MKISLTIVNGLARGANGIKWHKMETFSMEKMEKPLSNSPFMPFYAMNFDH